MNYLLDTNILLLFLRPKNRFAASIERQYTPFTAPNVAVLSVVTVGEIRSIAIQRQWGEKRVNNLGQYMSRFPIADIHVESIIQRYAEIDEFSQGKLQGQPPGTSARNMGKNDLWISATASVLDLTLLTTDLGFQHLDKAFLNVQWLDLSAL
jgi:predicted nucleic acid-binding protein